MYRLTERSECIHGRKFLASLSSFPQYTRFVGSFLTTINLIERDYSEFVLFLFKVVVSKLTKDGQNWPHSEFRLFSPRNRKLKVKSPKGLLTNLRKSHRNKILLASNKVSNDSRGKVNERINPTFYRFYFVLNLRSLTRAVR